jgi:SAM-dependent methyltransferase
MDDKKWQKYLGEELYAGGEESANVSYEEKIALSAKVLIFVPTEKKKVLVVGCGDGAEVKWLKDHGFDVTGITRNKKEVTNAKRIYDLIIDYGDMHELPYEKESFDCIFAKDVFEHAIAPTIVISEFYRTLKQNGWLIVTMPSREWANEFYHYNMLTHYQMYAMLKKYSFKALAGPKMKPRIPLRHSVTVSLGIKRGHIDTYIAKKISYKKPDYILNISAIHEIPYIKISKKIYDKLPASIVRVIKKIYDGLLLFIAKHHFE